MKNFLLAFLFLAQVAFSQDWPTESRSIDGHISGWSISAYHDNSEEPVIWITCNSDGTTDTYISGQKLENDNAFREWLEHERKWMNVHIVCVNKEGVYERLTYNEVKARDDIMLIHIEYDWKNEKLIKTEVHPSKIDCYDPGWVYSDYYLIGECE